MPVQHHHVSVSIATEQDDSGLDISSGRDHQLEGVNAFLERVRISTYEDHGDFLETLYPPSRHGPGDERILSHLFDTHPDDPRLADRNVGLFDVFAAPLELRLARARNDSEDSQYLFVLSDHLRRRNGEPCTVANLDGFERNFKAFTCSALRFLNWNNIIAAGESVLAAITPIPNVPAQEVHSHYIREYPSSDVDLYIYGLTPEQALLKIQEVFRSIRRVIGPNISCIRRKNSITIVGGFPFRQIHIILKLYQSPAEVPLGFDVDCCCFLFDGETVFASPRGISALITQQNTVDVSLSSPRYRFRLAQYGQKGYEIYVGTLNRAMFRSDLFRRDLTYIPDGLAGLLVLDALVTGRVDYQYLKDPNTATTLWEGDAGDLIILESLVGANDSASRLYDTEYIRVPYGPGWTVGKIRDIMPQMNVIWDRLYLPDHDLGSDQPNTNNSAQFDIGSLHVTEQRAESHHYVYQGDIHSCLEDINPDCTECSVRRKDISICGPLRFFKEEPGRTKAMNSEQYEIAEAYWAQTPFWTSQPRTIICRSGIHLSFTKDVHEGDVRRLQSLLSSFEFMGSRSD